MWTTSNLRRRWRMEKEKHAILECVPEPTPPARGQRHPGHTRTANGFRGTFALGPQAQDIDFVARRPQRIDFPPYPGIGGEIRVGDVDSSHGPNTTAKMIATQTTASNTHNTMTISHSRNRFQRITAWASDSIRPCQIIRPSEASSP